MILVLFILVWQILPIILSIALLVLYSKYKGLKNKYENNGMGYVRHGNAEASIGTDTVQAHPASASPVLPQSAAMQRASQFVPQQAPQTVPQQAQQPGSTPQQMHLVRPPVSAEDMAKIKEKQTVQVVNFTLIIGMLFILMAGLIFATTTWNIISSELKVFCIAMISIVFFAATFLIRRFLKIRLTEIAFYHLGCLFLCATVIALGFFEIFGTWFSLWGDGRPLVFLITMILLLALCMWGYRCYRATHLYYFSWGSSACIVWFLTESLGGDSKTSYVMVLLYGIAVLSRMLLKSPKKWMVYVHPCIVLLCLYECITLYLHNQNTASIISILFTGIVFGFYRFSKRFFPVSLNTYFAQILITGILFMHIFLNVIDKNGPIGLLSCLVLCTCLWFLYRFYKNPAAKYTVATLIVFVIGCIQYFLVQILFYHILLSWELSFTIVFSILTLTMFLERFLPRAKKIPFHFHHMLSVLVAVMALFGVLLCAANWYGTIILWELFALWFWKRERNAYMPIAAVIGIFLPSLTITHLFHATLLAAQLSIIATALFTCILACYLKTGFRKTVLTWIGYIGLPCSVLLFLATYCLRSYLESNPTYGVIGIVFILVSILLGWKKRKPLLFCSSAFLAPLTLITITLLFSASQQIMMLAGFVVALFLMLLGRRYDAKQKRGAVPLNTDHIFVFLHHVDLLSFSALTGFMGILFARHFFFWFCLFMIVWSANWFQRRGRLTNYLSAGTVLAWAYGIWLSQPWFEIPSRYVIPYGIVGLFLTCVAVSIIWKQHKSQVDIYWITIAILCTLAQISNCLLYRYLFDVLLLGGAMLGLLILAFGKKEFRWLTLSLGTLTALLLYLSRNFWLNLTWWAFLLIVGFILIGVAARHEYAKRRKKEKQDSTFRNWRW